MSVYAIGMSLIVNFFGRKSILVFGALFTRAQISAKKSSWPDHFELYGLNFFIQMVQLTAFFSPDLHSSETPF